MIEELVRMYNDGAITGYQLAMDCLHALDPKEPQLVLQGLPQDIYEELLEYGSHYDPGGSAPKERMMPAPDQVQAAMEWIKRERMRKFGVDQEQIEEAL